MFRCDSCNQSVGPCVSPIKTVTVKRPMVYTNHGVISKGWEIAKESNLCYNCNHQLVKKDVIKQLVELGLNEKDINTVSQQATK